MRLTLTRSPKARPLTALTAAPDGLEPASSTAAVAAQRATITSFRDWPRPDLICIRTSPRRTPRLHPPTSKGDVRGVRGALQRREPVR